MPEERRQYRRLAIRLPLECSPPDQGRDGAIRTVTSDVSTGGVAFEIDQLEGVTVPPVSSLLNIELTVPPGDGHFPYEGRVTGVAEVVRCDRRPRTTASRADAPARFGVAARFREPLRLAF